MHDYRYKYGDRPLEGYTIQRAAGKGGFGEVYYAVSDSGRQVAIKTVQNHEQIELRGIKQCMNLKSPHLVSIFDVKYNDRGQPFVIMEYVSGISLRDLLNEHPSGIGSQKAAFFLREIAKGLSHLHECGIVHRDLKPGNIFYENGYVKIGDYGLTKAISTSQHSGQTITVGTVHYMAPEIGEGKYDCSIDIYALGILFYEMLTGQVPFFGASPAEILMKHMKSEPELEGVDENFARVIRRALAKDPDERYKTVQEMVEDVFGTEHIRHSVSQFSPESLSVVAEKVAEKADTAQAVPPTPGKTDLTELGEKIGRRLGEAGDKLAEKMAQAGSQAKQTISQEDSINRSQRRILGLITMVLLSVGIGLIGGGPGTGFTSFFMIVGATLGISIARWRLLPEAEPGHWRNRLSGGLGILVAILVSGGAGTRNPGAMIIPLLPLCFNDWWKLTARDRKERIDWGPAIGSGMVAFFLAMFFAGGSWHTPVLLAGVIVGTIISVQVVSPFGRVPKSSPAPGKPFSPQKSIHNLVDRCRAQSCSWKEKFNQPKTEGSAAPPSPARPAAVIRRPVPGIMRILFMVGCMVFLGIGLSLLIAAACGTMRGDDFAISVFVGVDCLVVALFCLIRACTRTMTSWYRYLIKPLLKLVCLLIAVASAICLGNMHLHGDEEALAIILIVFPSILYFIIWFIPGRVVEELTGVRPAAVLESPSGEALPNPSHPALPRQRLVPGSLRILFMLGCVILLGIGLTAVIAAGCTMHGDDFTITVAIGVNCLLAALFCLIRACTRTMTSWYRYLIKPFLKLLCLITVVGASICLGDMHLRNEEEALAIILIVLPSILYLTIWLFPSRVIEELAGIRPAAAPVSPGKGVSPHKRVWALLVATLPTLGMVFGIQRFYVGKIFTGILWLCTFGLFGIGQLIDIILILTGRFRDAEGRLVRHWTAESARLAAEAQKKAAQAPVVEHREDVKEAPRPAQPAAAQEDQAVQAPVHRPSSHVTDFISAVDKLNPLGYLFAAFGTLLLVTMLLVGLAGVLRIPWLVAAGVPDPSINQDMTEVLGSSWPLLFDRLVRIVCVFFAVASATFFAIGRRRAGATHIIRAVIGILLMLGALSFLSDIIPQHYYTDGRIISMWQNGQTGPAIEELMAHTNDELFIPATCMFLASIVVLAWPPRRNKLVANRPVPGIQTD